MESRKSKKKSSSRAKEKPIILREVDDDSPNEWRTKKAHDRVARDPKGKGKAIQCDEPQLWLREDVPFNTIIDSIRTNTNTPIEEEHEEPPRKFVGQKMDPTMDYKAVLEEFAINTTRIINYDALDTLGIGDDVRWYLEALRLRTFVDLDYPAYAEESRQFLSTVTLSFPRCKHPLARDGVLDFIINERSYSLSIPDMSLCLGFDTSDVVGYGSFSGTNFWPRIANGAYDTKRAKSSMITHPAIRIVHRILAGTLFSRNNQTSVLTDELNTLQMPFVESPIWISYACLLASRLVKYKHEALTCSDKSPFTMYGTAITAIMLAAGVDLSEGEPLPRESMLDLCTLNTMRIISGATMDPDRIGYLYPIPPNLSRTILLPSISVPRLCDGHTSWTPPEDEFLNLRTGDHLPYTIGAFVRKKARVYRAPEYHVPPDITAALEEERAQRQALERQQAKQARKIAKMRRLLRTSGLDDSYVYSDDSTSDSFRADDTQNITAGSLPENSILRRLRWNEC